jgi:hypothetical protein
MNKENSQGEFMIFDFLTVIHNLFMLFVLLLIFQRILFTIIIIFFNTYCVKY